MPPLLDVQDLGKSYPTGRGKRLEVLCGVTFTVHSGELVAVVGESGTGKSTLLHLLGALDSPDSGTVRFEGQDIFEADDAELAAFRNRSIGFVFQFHHLLPEFTATENVAMPALIGGMSMARASSRALDLLRQMGLENRATHRPGELSGGEQQRVAMARALMNRPGLILADEPSGNLDEKTAKRLHAEILRLRDDFDQTFIIVTHNSSLAAICDRVLRIEGGCVIPVDGTVGGTTR